MPETPVLKRLIRKFDKPEYFFRPSQLARRLIRSREKLEGRIEVFTLPWKLDIRVRLSEEIGKSLWHLGVYDLALSEALWRLTDAGDRAADIGANIGYATSLMAARTGPSGHVTAFEPHPELFGALVANVARWTSKSILGTVIPLEEALSSKAGSGLLCIPETFAANSGMAFLHQDRNDPRGLKKISVKVETLDAIFDDERSPTIMKIDTEGTEAAVLRGGERLLKKKTIRDIIFEDYNVYPSAAMLLLREAGYEVFKLKKTFWGPSLESPSKPSATEFWEPLNFLATNNPTRARERFAAKGWRVLE